MASSSSSSSAHSPTLVTRAGVAAAMRGSAGMPKVAWASCGKTTPVTSSAYAVRLWFSPKMLKETYALSDDTRMKGMNELRALGLITVKREPINPGDFDIHHIRNTSRLNPDAFEKQRDERNRLVHQRRSAKAPPGLEPADDREDS
jgi:hypothetical protein